MTADREERLRAAVLVIAMHALALTAATSVAAPPPAKAPPRIQLISDTSWQFRQSGDGITPCEHSYRGFGFRLEGIVDVIVDIAPNSPAERAGLQVGDIVLNESELGGDRYPMGYEMTLRVERAGRPLNFRMRVERICQEKRT